MLKMYPQSHIVVSPKGRSCVCCPICPGVAFKSVFYSLLLGLDELSGNAVVNVEEPACNIDHISADSSCFKQ